MSLDAAPAAPAPPARRPRRRRALIGGISAVAVAALLGGYATWTLTAPVPTATIQVEVPEVTVPGAAELALSTDATATALSVAGGEAYLGAEASGIWASTGGDEPGPIASISKLITALVILDAKPLAAGEEGPTITFDRDDHALYDKYYVLGASIAAMPTGSSLSQHDALEAMLIVSACNYAEAVSNWAFGSQSAFLRAAREWLSAHGLANTTLVEPTGLDARNTSTPSDLIALGRIAQATPVIAEIVRMTSLDVPGIPQTPSTNELLGPDGLTGIKTGTLDGSGSNLLFSATVDIAPGTSLDVVGVILGGYTDDSVNLDVRALLGSLRAGFHEVPLAEEGQVVGRATTPWEESADFVLGEGATVLTWSDTPVTSTFRVDTLATGESGDTVGEITWVAGPSTVRVPLVLAGDIEPPTAWWRLTHPFDLAG